MLNLGFGAIIGFTLLMLVFFKYFANDMIAKNTLNVSIYSAFLCAGAYVNVAIASMLKEYKNCKIISEYAPIIIYALIFILLNRAFNFVFKHNHISSEVRTTSYRSMLLLQIICLLILGLHDILSIMLTFYLGEIFSVQLKGEKHNPENHVLQNDEEDKIRRERLISRCLNIILSIFILLDHKTAKFSPELILLGLPIGFISAVVFLIICYYVTNKKSKT